MQVFDSKAILGRFCRLLATDHGIAFSDDEKNHESRFVKEVIPLS